jgi:hypothetical protein
VLIELCGVTTFSEWRGKVELLIVIVLGKWQLCLLTVKVIAGLLFYVILNLPLRTVKLCGMVWICIVMWNGVDLYRGVEWCGSV